MKQRPRILQTCLLIIQFALLSCSAFIHPNPASTQPPSDVRLSELVTPTAYELFLSVSPSKPQYTGRVSIDLLLSADQFGVELHAKGLTLVSAVFTGSQGQQNLSVERLTDARVRLRSDGPLKAGVGRLIIDFKGALSTTPDGLYAVKDGEAHYIFSQFEPIAARTAFPCFDEPRFKAPFKISVQVPDGEMVVSNAPESGRRSTTAGKTTFDFKPTKPIPSYLVAFGVGPLEIVDTGLMIEEGIPFRIIVPKGKTKGTEFALRETPAIYRAIRDYLDASYPYQKLDFMAVPNFRAGAMENPGLVTYREPLLLVDETKVTGGRLRSIRGVIAHELAHMWFGNSVTLSWWNDIWLNEAFATWMADHVEVSMQDQARARRSIARSKQRVMRADAKKNVRAVRQEIKSDGDIENAFDGITYRKGASILWMLERWLGSDKLRSAIQTYVREFEHKAVTTDDLLRLLDRETGKSVRGVTQRFLDHPGVPDLEFEIKCKLNKAPTLTVTQTSSRKDAAQSLPWHIPVCVRYGQPSSTMKSCFELKDSRGEIELDGAVCPTWFYGNDGQSGYYSWHLNDEWLNKLLAHLPALSTVERSTLPALLRRRAEIGALALRTYVDALLMLLKSDEVALQTESLNNLVSLGGNYARTPKHRADFHIWLSARLHVLWSSLQTQTVDVADVEMVRFKNRVRRLLAFEVRDERVMDQGRTTLAEMLEMPSSEWTAEQREWFSIGAITADSATWLRLVELLKAERNSTNRGLLVRAIGASPQRGERAEARRMFTDGLIPAQDFWLVASGLGWRDRDERWSWLQAAIPSLESTLTEGGFSALPWLASGYCDPSRIHEMNRVFRPLLKAHPAMERSLALAAESISECARLRTLWQTDFKPIFSN